MALKPQLFGRYLLLDKVASGGMAEVWRGKLSGEQGFQRIYAIKKILPHVAEDEDFITMFKDEANITVSLQHGNIGQVFEFNKVNDTYFISMEYISGKDLKTVWSYCRSRKTTLPLEIAAYVVSKMADGLDYAHRRTDNYDNEAGIVHRDVSPQNVLLSWDGEVKVIDFGIAKASEKSGKTRPGTLKGKFAYMSPEQIRGLNLDGRADVFAIGVVLYELCTGERGFSADSEFSLLEMVRNVEIKPPTIVNRDIPAELERIIYKALAKDREHRYQTAAELSEDLQRFLIQRGKPPNRQDLSTYLRTNFTVDFEKERARLEAYKEITVDEISQPQPRSPAPAAPNDDPHDDATSAWDPASENDTFASSAPTRPQQPAQPQGIRPAARTNPVRVDTVTNETPANVARPRAPLPPAPSGSGKGVKLFAIAAGITLVVVAAVGVALWRLNPFAQMTVVVVTVTGAPGGLVRLDNRPPVRAEPSVTIDKVAAGVPHTLLVEEPGYMTWVPPAPIITSASNPLFTLKAPLKRLTGKFMVTSEPTGAAIFLDGNDTAKQTPSAIEVEGETLHEITLKLDGYKDLHKTDVKVAVSSEIAVRAKLIPDKLVIHIASSPDGAHVFIDGNDKNAETPYDLTLPSGSPNPQLKLTHHGCKPYETTIALDDRPQRNEKFSLTCR